MGRHFLRAVMTRMEVRLQSCGANGAVPAAQLAREAFASLAKLLQQRSSFCSALLGGFQ